MVQITANAWPPRASRPKRARHSAVFFMTDNLLGLVLLKLKPVKRILGQTVSPLSSGKKSPPVQSIECCEPYNIQSRLSALFSPAGDPEGPLPPGLPVPPERLKARAPRPHRC